MKLSPFFSVIIPVYKVEQYLTECVDSVRYQTFENFEIILVDDGSPDDCPRLCDEYAKQDARIIVIHKKNGGLSDARNSGITIARGKWLVFLDGDDHLISNNCMNSLYMELEKTDCEICHLNCIITNFDYSLSKSNCFKKNYIINQSLFMKNIVHNKYKMITACTLICKRTFILQNNLFFFSGILHEDEEWVPRVVCALNLLDKICIFNNPFYFYRINRMGAITETIKIKNVIDKLFIVDRIFKMSDTEDTLKKKFLLTRSAQILVFILMQCKNIYSIMPDLQDLLTSHLFVLKRSHRIKHKVLYLLLKVKGLK